MTSSSRIESASQPQIETLSNGMRCVFLPSAANNIVALLCFFGLPGGIESPAETGLVSFTSRMLMRGTTRLSSADLAAAIESLGTSIGCDVTDDFSYAHMVCTSDTFAESLPLLAEVIQKPSFEPEEIEKERQTTIAAIRRSEDDKFTYTYQAFLREIYGDHAYGFPRRGTVETVAEFRREQIADLHSEAYNPAQFFTICVGNFLTDEARRLIESSFTAKKSRTEPFIVPPVLQVPPARKTLSRECEQSFLVAGMQTCGIQSRDWPAMRVMNTILGEGMSSRLFTHLRDEKGLAYATGSSYSPMRYGGHLFGYIGTKPESLSVAREGMLQEFENIRKEHVSEEELERSRNYIIGKFLIDHQTNYRRGFYLGFYEMMELGMAMDEEYPKRIAAITAADVKRVANTYLKDATIVELIPE
jgi:predicted Zn-dependent peptidase